MERLHKGSTLIEVLITMLVVSIGLLGMASLQLRAMTLNHGALQRLHAINLANEIADSIYLNSDEAANNQYQIGIADNSAQAPDTDSIAFSDVTQWLQVASEKLPQGDIFIGNAAQVDSVWSYPVFVCWTDKLADIEPLAGCGTDENGVDRVGVTLTASSRN